MSTEKHTTKNLLLLTPLFGSIIFVVIYVFATLLYPGGSQANRDSIGFSWMNNYWCTLLNETAINGQPNPSRPIAIGGMFVLNISLSAFWILLPKYLNASRMLRLLIQSSGLLAMAISMLLFTQLDHDLVINFASCIGIVATVGTFILLQKNGWKKLFLLGIFNILLVIVNNYFYYSKDLIVYLPVVQKISFASFLFWVSSVSIQLFIDSKKRFGIVAK